LDNWSGIGLIIAGMTHQGGDVQLTAYARLARELLPGRDRALRRRRVGLGADAVAGGAAGGVDLTTVLVAFRASLCGLGTMVMPAA
jgi:hypothetical protein